MPKLKPDTQRARRAHILDAAEICFARSGFHRCTMDEICKEAGISPGALYGYFKSKEELIAGLAERDRMEFQERFAPLSEAADILSALRLIGEQYFVDEPVHKRRMCVEIGLESTRNAQIGDLFHMVDDDVRGSFRELIERLAREGRIAPALEPRTSAELLSVIADGMMWRRAIDPDFKPAELIPAVTALIGMLLNPVQPTTQTPQHESAQVAPPRTIGPATPHEAALSKPSSRRSDGRTKQSSRSRRTVEDEVTS